MDKDLKKLKPELLWTRFSEICAVPRPSHHEEKIREYIIDFAKRHNLDYTVDAGPNIIIRKPATPGMENRKTVVLQAHLDMVPQKNSDKEFDFEKDGIEAYIDGDWVTANGTTLGADNGIGASAILAVLEDRTVKHGPIEALFTATEETGMDGAFALRPGELKGDILINLDSETEGELYVGCAGGLDLTATMKYDTVKLDRENLAGYRLEIKGLKGGHSGMEIILQRANANKLFARFMRNCQEKLGIMLCDIDGGGLRNAIPREAFATVAVMKKHEKAFQNAVKKFEKIYIDEYKGIEDGISFKAVPVKTPSKAINFFDQANLVDAVAGTDLLEPRKGGVRTRLLQNHVPASQFGEYRKGRPGPHDTHRLRAHRSDRQDFRSLRRLESEHGFAHSQGDEGWIQGTLRQGTGRHGDTRRTRMRHHRRQISRHGHDILRPHHQISPFAR